jgi:hypothetical protein
MNRDRDFFLFSSRVLFVGFTLLILKIVFHVSRGQEAIAGKTGSLAFILLFLSFLLNSLNLFLTPEEKEKITIGKPLKIQPFLPQQWPLVILGLLGVLVPLRWFSQGQIIAGGDQVLYYNPTNVFNDYFYTWLERTNLGIPNLEIQILFPLLSFFKFLQLLGFSALLSQVIWAILLFSLSGLSMYFLVIHLVGKKVFWPQGAGFVAAVFYLFNPFLMLDPLQIGARPVQALFPLIFLLWIKGLRSLEKDQPVSWRPSILFALSTLFLASFTTNPALVAPILITIALYTLYFVFLEKLLWLKALFFSLKSSALVFLFNLWWLVSSLSAFRESGEGMTAAVGSYHFLKSTKIWEALRLMGYWAFRNRWGPDKIPHIPYAPFYYQLPLLFISFLFPVLAFSGLILKKRNKKSIFFALTFLTGVFLMKGTNPPFGSLFKFLYDKIPLMAIFRNPYSKFTLLSLFSLSALLGLSWAGFTSLNWFRRHRFLLTGALLTINLFLAYPLLTGQAFQDLSWHGITQDSLKVEIPDYWFKVGEHFQKNDPESRIILFPKSGYGTCYNWKMGTCGGEPVGRMFLPNQVIKYPGAEGTLRSQVLNSLYDSIFDASGSLKNFVPALGSFGVKYILQQNDLDWTRSDEGFFDPQKMKKILKSQEGLSLEESFGQLDVYSLAEEKIYPWIYGTSDLTFFVGGTDQTGKLLSFSRPRFPESSLFSGHEKDLSPRFLRISRSLTFSEVKAGYPGKVILSFQTARDGQYDLSLFNQEIPKDLLLTLDDERLINLDQAAFEKEDHWLEIGKLELKSGPHQLVAESKSVRDLSFLSFAVVDSALETNDDLETSPEISFKRINPTRFEVKVKNVRQSYYLVFLSSFSQNWKVYSSESDKSPLPEDRHFIINGFANAWYLGPSDVDGATDYSLTIKYRPQKFFYLGLIISGLSLGFALIILFKKSKK